MLRSHVEYEVPVLYVADGMAYVPVMARCEILGLRMVCRMWTVCACCQDGFSRIRAKEITCSTRREMLLEHPDTLPFEVSPCIVQLRGASHGREDLYLE